MQPDPNSERVNNKNGIVGGALPVLLQAVLDELQKPRGLHGHYLEKGMRMFIPLSGPTMVSVVTGNVRVYVSIRKPHPTKTAGYLILLPSARE